jgi:protein involved in polysaccharide export with SLBB domain
MRDERATRTSLTIVAALAAAMQAAALMHAQQPATRVASAVQVSGAPVVDGALTERDWSRALVVTSFEVAEQARPSRSVTEVRTLADANALYLGVTCRDGASGAPGFATGEDRFIVEIDPFDDRSRLVYLSLTESGQVLGARNGGAPMTGAWRAAVARTGEGWTAEMEIPFVSLGLTGSTERPLKINFVRYDHGLAEWSRWVSRPDGSASGVLTNLLPATPTVAERSPAPQPIPPPLAVPPLPPAPLAVPPLPPALPPLTEPEPVGALPPAVPPPPPTLPAPQPVLPPPPPPAFEPAQPVAPPIVPTPEPPAPAQPGVREEYIVRPGDMLQIKHFNNPELNELLPIRPDGRISLDLVGEIDVMGLSVSRLQALLTQRYARLLRQPDVTVIVKEFGGAKVYVGGEVNAPGILTLRGRLTALQAIFEAGGHKLSGKLKSVVILRDQGTDQPFFMAVNLNDALKRPGAASADVALQPNDIVFVPKTTITKIGEFVNQYIDEVIPIPVSLGLAYALDAAIRP